MRTHTTKDWTNAAIYFYAASPGADGGAYRLDNVSLHQDLAVSSERTDCVDPTSPTPTAVAEEATIITNGDFSAGLDHWGVFGQIVHQIANGVFEFYRPPGTPAGVVLQNTAQAMAAGQVITSTFDLGNSSAVRKRVTVLLHDNDFTDLTACTFWLAPGQPLSRYTVRTFTTEAWSNATLSIYPATVGLDQWIRLDNATLQRTPASAIVGTECLEPGPFTNPFTMTTDATATAPPPSVAPVVVAAPAQIRARPAWLGDGGFTASPTGLWEAVASTGIATLERTEDIDLRDASAAYLVFDSWLKAARSLATVEVSLGGSSWLEIDRVPQSETWQVITIDLTAYVGQEIRVRFVLETLDVTDTDEPDVWYLDALRIEIEPQA